MTIDKATGDRWKALNAEGATLEHSIKPQIDAIRATIEPRRTEIATEIGAIEDEHGELQCCEGCGDPHLFEELFSEDDGWFCKNCCSEVEAA